MRSNYRQLYLCLFLSLIVFGACNKSNTTTTKEYKNEIDSWHQQRIKSLTQDDSWLSLTGLYWLDEGKNTFGGDTANDMVFPGQDVPGHIGSFRLQDSTVTVTIAQGVDVTTNDNKVDQMKLKSDASGDVDILHHGSLSWYVIKRSGDRYGIRLKDSKSDLLTNFKGIERYPVDAKWRVEATFTPYDSVQTIDIPTIIGDPSKARIPGTLQFQLNGTSYRMLPIEEGGDQWFIVFGDQTNGDATYGGGRFIYIDKAGDDNKTVIDFNKAYNPPCAFTAFATCPLPPSENKLDMKVTAGEKKYGEGHHHSN